MLNELLEYVTLHHRVCPQPSRWDELWRMLPLDAKIDGKMPGMPLILGAWWDTPALLKQMRLREHIEYAQAVGVLHKVDAFLRALPEAEWAHHEDF